VEFLTIRWTSTGIEADVHVLTVRLALVADSERHRRGVCEYLPRRCQRSARPSFGGVPGHGPG
jgi:hypothetical protein